MSDNVKAIAITRGLGELDKATAEEITSFIARVSNPANQMNFDTAGKLIKYCVDHKHVSILEHVYLTVSITTTISISSQLLRHRSFTFQQFSQRYAKSDAYVPVSPRRQDKKNRQNSIDDMNEDEKKWFLDKQQELWNSSYEVYEQALARGISKESARTILPVGTQTTLFMTGNARSWLFYIEQRTDPGTQLEHRQIAEEIKKIFIEHFPEISVALQWIV